MSEAADDVQPSAARHARSGCTKAAVLGYYDLSGALAGFEPFETAIRADYCYDGQSHTAPGRRS